MPKRCRQLYQLFLLLIPITGFTQQKRGSFMAYGPEAKYFSNLNFSVYQAKNGFLWIGTQNGLVRFDGKRYTNFYADYANPNSPSDNTIMDIIEDKNGDLWFTGYYHGVSRYNQQTGQFKKYPRLSKDQNDYYGIYSGLKDNEGNLWFCTAGRGLAKYLYDKDSFALYFPESNAAKDGTIRGDNYVTSVDEDPSNKNILWCGTFHGLYAFDKRSGEFSFFSSGIRNLDGTEIALNDVEPDNRGNLWIGSSSHGLLCFNTRELKFEPTKAKSFPNVVYHIKRINDSLLYIAAISNGLWQYDLNSNIYNNISPPAYAGDPSATNMDIQRISVTPGAGIFVGGNYYLYQQHPAYLRLKKNIVYPDHSSSSNSIYLEGLLWDATRKKYWVCTFGGNGLYELSEDFSEIRKAAFKTEPANRENYFLFPVADAMQRVWVINGEKGLWGLDNETGSFGPPVHTLPFADSIARSVSKMKTSKEGNIWIVSKRNFIYWDVKSNTATQYPIVWNNQYKGEQTLEGEIELDIDGNAWLITQSGLFYCNRKSGKVEHIFQTGSTMHDLSDFSWTSGGFDKYSGLWLTAANGVQVYDWKERYVLANHYTDGGLATMRVNLIETDDNGRIWAATAAGLGFFDPAKKVWQLFNRDDGLENDYLDNKLFITSNNKVAIDQVNGFVIRDSKEVISDNTSPILNITSLMINEKLYSDSLLRNKNYDLSLKYMENNIRIEFGAMDWLYPSRTTYWYTMEGPGMSPSRYKSTDATITLTRMQPGKYKIYIQALSGNGIWSNDTVLSITIKPPYWKTTWFIALCILAGLAVIYAVYRYRLNQYKRVQSMRNNIARDLHDDIGASLTNISILNELAKRHSSDAKVSGEYLTKASEDIQHISESLSDIVWNINPRYDEIANLFIRMKRYAADMMDGKNIGYEIIFPEKIAFTLPMEKRRDLYMIFKEAVNNLAKYSKATKALIRFSVAGNRITMEITDNGKGFDMSAVSEGNGLLNMKQRAEKWNGDLKIISAVGKGTSVFLDM